MNMKLVAVVAPLAILVGSASAQVSWNNDATNILKLTENIVNNADGTYTYNYSLTNLADSKPIWWVVLYHNNVATSDTGYPNWASTSMYTYAGTDINSPEGQLFATYTWDDRDSWPTNTPNGVGLGQTVTGFSYTSAVLDTSVKRFVADREGEWGGGNLGHNANNAQIFTYGGTTSAVPEPASMLALGLGVAGFLARRRRK